MFKRVLAMTLALMLMIGCFGVAVYADVNSVPEEFEAFIAYGGDKVDDGDWGYGYAGVDAEGITAVKETIKVGETKTISLTFAEASPNAWYFAPCLVADNVVAIRTLKFDIVCKINGEEVEINKNADADGKLWWMEGTGDYQIDECIRLAGGYNEWGTKYIEEPSNITSIEYTITLKAVSDIEGGYEFETFIAYGGDKAEENDWGYGYTGSDVEGITAVKETIRVGETKTISLTFDQPSINAWYFAPCLVAESVGAIQYLDFDITCKINGEDVTIDMAADADGKTWWTEGTGDYQSNECIRLGGGYNEWATKYVAEPTNVTSIEYTITLNEVSEQAPNGGEQEPVAALPEQFELFVAYGGDKAEENDWAYGYTGTDVEGIAAVKETIKVGETKTVSLTFAEPSVNAWYFAPCLVAEDVSGVTGLEFTVVCKINGEEVTVDMAADSDGKVWWTEATGDYTATQCIRLAGGFNEWATKYIQEPSDITSIEYTVTLTAVTGDATGDENPVEGPVFDPAATYNAYLLLQTPNWTYRNAWNDKTNGIDAETWGNALYGNETDEWYGKITDAVLAGNGTYTIEITDFGTIFEDDFATAGQDYFNILGFTSDAPLGGLTITNVKLIVDGTTRHTVEEGYQNPDDTEYVNILIQNIWNSDVKEISYYPAPTTSLKIEFTVSGFSYDKKDENTVTPDPTEPTPNEPTKNDGQPANTTAIVIAVVAVVVVAGAVVAVIVLKKKKNA